MKFKIFSMVVILGVISVLPMIYMGKFDSMPFIGSIFKGGTSEFEQLKAKTPKNLTNVVTDEKVQVYKWRDKNGVMQFSKIAPVEGSSEKIELNPNENIIQAVKIPVEEVEQEIVKSEKPNPYSIKDMKKVMDDARGVEDLLQNRFEDQQKALNNL